MPDRESLTEQVTIPRGETEKTHWNLGKSFQGRAPYSLKLKTEPKGPEARAYLECLKSSGETR